MIPGYYEQVRTEIEALLPPRIDTVMEIGCANGGTLQWLKRSKGAKTTIGVESDETAAEKAATRCDKVVHLDVAHGLTNLAEYTGALDLLLMLDVLEHLIDPWVVLRQAIPLLAERGTIIASIPNIRNVKALGPLLLRGSWTYAESGILDRTHLRFFTRTSAITLFREAGLEVEKVVATGPVSLAGARTARGRLGAIINALVFRVADDFLANQYLIAATPPAHGPGESSIAPPVAPKPRSRNA